MTRVRQIERWSPWALVGSALLLFAALSLIRLDFFTWSDDEAVFVLTAQAVEQGNRLYDVVWLNYLPGMVQWLRAAFAVGGFSLSTARIAVFCLSVLGLLAVLGLGRVVGSLWSGVFGVVLLATAPHFLSLSSAVLADIPAGSLAAVCALACMVYRRTRRRSLLCASALAYAASVWFKPTTALAAAAPMAAIWLARDELRQRIYDLALFCSVVLLSLGAGMLSFSVIGLLRQFGLTYLRSRGAFEFGSRKTLRSLAKYFFCDKYSLTHVSWLLLAVWALRGIWAESRADAALLAIWLGSVLLTLFALAPLYRHHLVQILFPLSVLAGDGLARAASGVRRSRRILQGVLLGLVVAVTLFELARSLAVDAVSLPVIEADRFDVAEDATRFLATNTAQGDFVITDGHMLALRAERPVPPELTNTSRMRIKTVQLSDNQVIEIAQRPGLGAIVFWERKLSLLRGFGEWVRREAVAVRAYPHSRIIYMPRTAALPDFPQLASVASGWSTFEGVSIPDLAVEPGDTFTLSVHLLVNRMTTHDYTLFVHLLDSEGALWGQVDVRPLDGQYLSSDWPAGQSLVQSVEIPVSADAPPGEMLLAVGLYDANGQRAEIRDGTGQPLAGNQVILEPRPVVRWASAQSAATPKVPLAADFGGKARLLGYDLGDGSLEAGDDVYLVLHWQALATMRTTYTVFVHVLDGEGQIVAQCDQAPGSGAFPTTGWVPGERIQDRHIITLPSSLAIGSYFVAIGLYDQSDGSRLPIAGADAHTEGDQLLLTERLRAER